MPSADNRFRYQLGRAYPVPVTRAGEAVPAVVRNKALAVGAEATLAAGWRSSSREPGRSAAERVSTGLLCTRIGLQPVGLEMLATADHVAGF